ncbi:MAG: hypothetical protein RJA70_164 [Pseudomonadota bacterium]
MLSRSASASHLSGATEAVALVSTLSRFVAECRLTSDAPRQHIAEVAHLDSAELEVVGWREYVAFPDFDIPRLLAKVDTGARTSAIHAEDIQDLGDGWVRFKLVIDRESGEFTWQKAKLLRTSRVKPSSGRVQHRYVIETKIRLGTHQFKTEISLVSRGDMLCRMLVGRETLRGRYLVNPDRRFVVSKRPPRDRSKPPKIKKARDV